MPCPPPIPILIKLTRNHAINTVVLIDPSTGYTFTSLLSTLYAALRPKIPEGYFYDVEEYCISPDDLVVIWNDPGKGFPGTTKVTAGDWAEIFELMRVRKGVDVLQVGIVDVNLGVGEPAQSERF
ncbi:hypothetical protein BJX70DRAFT_393434 [Aspergillus crustosus]